MENIKKWLSKRGINFEVGQTIGGSEILFINANYDRKVIPYLNQYHNEKVNYTYRNYFEKMAIIENAS